MLKPKVCVECQKVYTPANNCGEQEWLRRIYCSNFCCQRFRRRVRHRHPHPQEVLDALAANKHMPSDNRLTSAPGDFSAWA